MKKTLKKAGTIRQIKNISLTSTQQKSCFEPLESKVSPSQKVMIAVSGGSDSILTACLLYKFFVNKKYDLQNLFFIHCNHATRKGNASDETFITTFFEGTQLIITKRVSKKHGTEAELRNRRYGEFKKYAKKQNIDQIIFWHNLTDRIESTFLNLLRGANMNGFIAMQVQEPHHLLPWIQVLRPILWITKNEVTDICKKNKIPFVTDPTNNDITTSLRNKLRNKVLPELYKLANKQSSTTNSYIESMKNMYTQLDQSKEKNIILKTIKKSPHRNASFAYQRIIDPNEIMNESIMQVIKKLNISNNVTTPLLNELTKFLKNSESGYKYFNKTYFFKSHGNIYSISAPKWFWEKTVDSQKKIDILKREKNQWNAVFLDDWVMPTTWEKASTNKMKWLQISKADRDTTTVKRFPNKGDRYKGKTRNEWCINQKIPIFRRNFIPIIVKKNKIIKVFRTA